MAEEDGVIVGELLEEEVQNDSKQIHENALGQLRRDKGLNASNLVNGLSVKPIFSMNDFPPIVNGFRNLEQDTLYLICAVGNPNVDAPLVMATADKFLIPAGWNGTIRSSHTPRNGILYLGANSLLNTLNIDGSILLIDDSITEPGVKSTIVASAPHGLLDGQYVNVTGTLVVPTFSQQRLQVSNVTVSTFDVSIVFTATDVGFFDTGVFGLLNWEIPFYSSGAGNLYDISFTPDPNGLFNYDKLLAFNFKSLGIVRKAPFVVGFEGITTFLEDGLTLEDCDTITLGSSVFSNIDPLNTTANCLTIQGNLTRDVIINGVKLNTANAGQHPVRIDGSINNADALNILNCPDNNVSTDYFDVSAGGLDQTNKQVVAQNNGKRKNSADQSESMSNGVLEIDGSGGIDIRIEDVTPNPGDFTLDGASEGFSLDTTTGVITYNGRVSKTVKIEYSVSISQTSGGSQNIEISLYHNSIRQTKTIRLIPTVGVGTFIPVAYLGGFFDISPGDTFELFKHNTTNSTNTDIENLVLLIK